MFPAFVLSETPAEKVPDTFLHLTPFYTGYAVPLTSLFSTVVIFENLGKLRQNAAFCSSDFSEPESLYFTNTFRTKGASETKIHLL